MTWREAIHESPWRPAVSDDHGATFAWVATLDDTEELNYRVHYPTLIEVNDKLLIFYSKFYVGKCVVPPGRENATVVGRCRLKQG